MRIPISFLLLLSLGGTPSVLTAQNTLFDKPVKRELDSIRNVLQHTDNNTLKMSAFRDLHFYYSEMNRDTALYFAEKHNWNVRKFSRDGDAYKGTTVSLLFNKAKLI